MKSMKNIGALLAFAALADLSTQPKGRPFVISKEKVEPPIPKGCNVYYFLENGSLSDTPTKYKVIAINKKPAIKKSKKLFNQTN